jgi:hypothetical protein
MRQHILKDQIIALLAEAEHSSDLMDRTDYQHLLSRLSSATRELLEAHQQLEEEHEEMASRLNRVPSTSRVPRELHWPQFAIANQS